MKTPHKAVRNWLTTICGTVLVSTAAGLGIPATTYAATGGCAGQNLSADAAEKCLFDTYVNPFIALLSAAVGVVVVISIIYGSIEFIQSGGDPGKAASGKKHITNALIGLAAFLMLYGFLQFILPGGLFNHG